MYFPTAGIEVSPWVPVLVAFAVSFFTSMGGVSGAFLLLPFQMSFLGYTSPSVSATNHLFNIVAIPSGVYRYIREQRMVWPLTWVVISGTLPGVFIGAVVRIRLLPDPRTFKLFAALVLLYIGAKMIKDLQAGSRSRQRTRGSWTEQPSLGSSGKPEKDIPVASVQVTAFSLRHIGYTFRGQDHLAPTPGIFALSLVVGVVGGIYGIGGGSIIAPFFVTFFGLPVHTVAGAALMGTFVTSVAGVLFFQLISPFYPGLAVAPDWLLGVLFGLGGMAGMYLGARCQKHVPAAAIKLMLTAVILITAAKYVLDYFSA